LVVDAQFLEHGVLQQAFQDRQDALAGDEVAFDVENFQSAVHLCTKLQRGLHGRRKDFFQGVPGGNTVFSKGPTGVKFHFTHSKLQQPGLPDRLKIFQGRFVIIKILLYAYFEYFLDIAV